MASGVFSNVHSCFGAAFRACCLLLLQTNPSLIRLDLGNTELETDAVIALSTVLQSNVILQELSLENPRLFSRMVSST